MPYNLRNMKLPSFLYTNTSAVALIAEEYWAQVYFAYPEPGDDEVYFTWKLSRDDELIRDAVGNESDFIAAPLNYHSPALVALFHLLHSLKESGEYGIEFIEGAEQVIADIKKHSSDVEDYN